MPQQNNVSNAGYVASQYRSPTNLEIRIRMHKRYSVNAYGWQRWVLDQLDVSEIERVLDLGCGTAEFWRENAERVPRGLALHLTDLSIGMLRQAREATAGLLPVPGVANVETIPFADRTFDLVVANHMLYHVADKRKAVGEIRRVLAVDGVLGAATIGNAHLKEIAELVKRYDRSLIWWGAQMADSFTLENGRDYLAPWFDNVETRRYDDAFLVTEADDLVDYILSGRIELSDDQISDFRTFVRREFERNGNAFHITKDSGLFVARGTPVRG